jgi:MFS family permease
MMNTQERRLIYLTGMAHFLSHGYTLILPAIILLLIKEFDVGYFVIGVLANICGFFYGLGALPAGFLADRLGSRRILALSFLGSAFSCIFVAFSYSFTGLAVSLGLLGLFGSLYHPAGLSLISKSVREVGRSLGYHGMAGNIGLALTPFLASGLAAYWGWRWVYLFFSLPGLFIGLLALKLPVEEEKEEIFERSGENYHASYTNILSIVLLLLVSMFTGFCYQGFITYLPTYLAMAVQTPLIPLKAVVSGGLLTTIALLLGVWGQYLGGKLSDLRQPEKLYWLSTLVIFPSLFLMGATRDLLLVLVSIIFGFSYFFAQPVGNRLLTKYTSHRFRGLGFGVFFFMGFGLGSFASSLGGYIGDNYSLNMIYYALGVIMLIISIISACLYQLNKDG